MSFKCENITKIFAIYILFAFHKFETVQKSNWWVGILLVKTKIVGSHNLLFMVDVPYHSKIVNFMWYPL